MSLDIHKYAIDPAAFQHDICIPSAHGPRPFVDVMAPFQRERFAAINPALLAIAKGEQPPFAGIWDERTKGASKDSDHAVNLLWLLAFSPRTLRIQIGAYDAAQADEIRLIIKAILKIDTPLNRMLGQVIDVQTNRIISRRTDSLAEILTTDKLGSHGSRPDVVLINELTHQTDDGFASTLLDNADKIPTSLTIIATNAGHDPSWQLQWKRTFAASPRWRVFDYSQPAPWISQEALADSQKRNSRARFNRLWRGIWAKGGDALDIETIDAAFGKNLLALSGAEADYVYAVGVDLSRTSDYTAAVIVGKHTTGRIRVARVHVWRPDGGRVNQGDVAATLLDDHDRFHFGRIAIEAYDSTGLLERLQEAGIGDIVEERALSGPRKTEECSALLSIFNAYRIDCYADSQLDYDIRHLSIEEKSYGMKLVSQRGPHGHGDVATALSIALVAVRDLEIPQKYNLDGFDFDLEGIANPLGGDPNRSYGGTFSHFSGGMPGWGDNLY